MKILIIANGYPTKREPQLGCFEKDHALALQKHGHEIIMMSVDSRFRLIHRKIGTSYFKDRGLNIYSIFWFPLFIVSLINKKWTFRIKQKMALSLYKRIEAEQGRPDIIYAHYLTNIALGATIKRKFAIPLVGMEHWSLLNDEQLPEEILVRGKFGYEMADWLISVSDSLRLRILHHFNKDSSVIHNMIGEEFLEREINLSRKVTNFNYISVGSLIKRKGFDVLITAFLKSGLKNKGAVLRIIGDGNERKKLQNQIDNAGLHENIILEGRKMKPEIIKMLYNSDVFVLPSRAENFSVAVLEALSAGLPVIATLCGGIEECININNGLLVPVDDSDAMAVALLNMYSDISQYDKSKIVKECRDKYSPEIIVDNLNSIFKEVIEKSQDN